MNDTEPRITQQTAQDFDRILNSADMDALYEKRRQKVTRYLQQNGIVAAVFEDSEERREPALRYLCGHPSDGLLVLTADGDSTLIAWDEHLAHNVAHAKAILPYTQFGRKNTQAVSHVLASIRAGDRPSIDIPPSTPHPLFLDYAECLGGWDVQCRPHGTHDFVANLRAQKDEYEIACIRKACAITSRITDAIEARLRKGSISSETDVALFIEKELRAQGCERTGFDTLAAGPGRSYAIHAFPGYTAGGWGQQGLSILDYGVVYNGYTSDATITIARGPLTREQQAQIQAVQEVADTVRPLYANGLGVRAAAKKAEELFARGNAVMPHGLGHGIGLEIHEEPFVSLRADDTQVFRPGMAVTLEPGLYDPQTGGCRLENDILICEEGNLLLTNSRIITL